MSIAKLRKNNRHIQIFYGLLGFTFMLFSLIDAKIPHHDKKYCDKRLNSALSKKIGNSQL